MMQDTFVSVVTSIIQEVSMPVAEDKTRNVTIWLGSECSECSARRERSGLKRRIESVNWNDIANRKKCAVVVSDSRIIQ